jgi:hypothetical protein
LANPPTGDYVTPKLPTLSPPLMWPLGFQLVTTKAG